jgi:hypothetical protein
MNNNALNWSDNRVVGSAGTAQNKSYKEPPMPPYQDPATSGYDNRPDYQRQGVSPPTYQQGAAPSAYRQPSSATAQDIQSTEGTQTRNDAYAPNSFTTSRGAVRDGPGLHTGIS